MNIALIGSGGREHALCYKLKKSKKINELICIPGNAGTKNIAQNIDVNFMNLSIKPITTNKKRTLYLMMKKCIYILR